MKATLNTNGFDDYLEALATMESDFEQNAGEALLAGAEPVKEMQKELAPVYNGRTRSDVIPGNLRDNISISEPKADGNFIFVEIGLLKDHINFHTKQYGTVIEYGTSSKKAYSFIRAGAAQARTKFRNAVKNKLKELTGLDFK